MRTLTLLHLCLLLPHLITPSCAILVASSYGHTFRADLTRTDLTTEKRVAPSHLLSLQQDRAHGAITFNSLHRRGDDIHFLNNGWIIKFLSFDSGLPISIASTLLEDFYARVLERVHDFATTMNPLKTVSLVVHDLHLDFVCDSVEVSWDFIEEFINAMLRATRKGFVGKFTAVMFHVPTNAVVKVALRILGASETSGSTETTAGS